MEAIINTRSPFYIKVTPTVGTIIDAEVEIYIYSGTFQSTPSSSDLKYTITKSKIGSNNYVVFEISELIRDYILNDYYTGSTTTNCVWVQPKLTINYNYISGQYTETPTPINYLAVDGYGYFDEGANPVLDIGYMQSNTIIYRPSDENIAIPVFRDNTNNTSVKYYNGSSLVYTVTVTATTNSLNKISYSGVPISPSAFNKVEVVSNYGSGNVTETINVYDLDCSKYTPIKVTFINKFGVLQELWFDKRSNESIESSSNTYKASVMDFSTSTPSYNTSGHQDVTLDLVGKESIVMNTGYIDESFNEVFRQLMLSELVWMQDPDDSSSYLPLRPKTQSLQFKTRVNDKLVNYTVEFDFAFDKINTIR